MINQHNSDSSKKHVYPRINWGRGRLLPYESKGSFTSKFCKLNGIRPDQFRKFYLTYYHDSEKFFSLLDEEQSIIAKQPKSYLNLSGCFGTFGLTGTYVDSDHLVSFCPDCIKMGYHASFHEFSWLKLCPIHKVKLITEDVHRFQLGSHSDHYVKKVGQLLEEGLADCLSKFPTTEVFNKINSSSMNQFVTWIEAVKNHSVKLYSYKVVSLTGSHYQMCDLDVLLGRIDWAIGIPKRIQGLLTISAKKIEPTIVEYPIEVVKKLVSLTSTTRYEFLLKFYKINVILNNETPKYLMLIKKFIVELRIKNGTCSSRWGWEKSGWSYGWSRVHPENWGYCDLLSPYEYAINMLQEDWTDLNIEFGTNKKVSDAWDYYGRLGEMFQKLGYAFPEQNKKINYKGRPGYYNQIYTINYDQDLKILIENLLYEEAVSIIDQIWSLIEELSSDGLTELRELPSRGNLFLEPTRAYLCTWPVENVNTVNSVANIDS